ncbi:hypothetical protein [Myroides sp. LoEW2-1]|uniref:hypothetical protein n=1 Tax=Myroides sp. LoEW2-1 TaxID=2683192 RepID=UPI001327FC10|nr:hypothetical protein [Myroides sp. LoEW2-1]MVX36085.1 hypothetical protein [Myroides sp. LoEW2-1]
MKKVTKRMKFTSSILMLTFLLISAGIDFSHAQEKKNDFKVKSTTYEYKITKETKDTDLELIKKEVNDEKVATLNFSNIKRNDKGEIIAITTKFIDERGSSQQKSEYNSMGISPYSITIHENDKGDKYLEISTPNNPMFSNQSNFGMQSSMFGNSHAGEQDSFFTSDIMEMMQSMQEDMQRQREEFMKMMQQHSEPTEAITPQKTK